MVHKMAKTIRYTWARLEEDCVELSRALILDDFKPDMVISLTPSAEIIKIMLCNFFEISLSVQLSQIATKARILYVDDIASDILYNQVQDIKQQSFMHDIKYATLFEGTAEINPPDYSVNIIQWVVETIDMPWEYYWKKTY